MPKTQSETFTRQPGLRRAGLRTWYRLALDGREKYAEKIRKTFLTVCDFPSWNPSHFLDAVEMSHAVGVGYDWIYHELDEPTRKHIRRALMDLGLKRGIECHKSGYHHLTYAYHWNQVCNLGLLIGALAVAEPEPET